MNHVAAGSRRRVRCLFGGKIDDLIVGMAGHTDRDISFRSKNRYKNRYNQFKKQIIF